MNNFGLGLVLSFTDNATSGVRKAAGAFTDLEGAVEGVVNASSKSQALLQMSYSAGILGNELYGVGKKITSIFTEAISTIANVGNVMGVARSQLSSLYDSDAIGEAVLQRTRQYAKDSIYSFDELISSIVTLKSSGINAFAELSTSAYKATNGVEGASQTILDYASDLAAFKPNMRNAYGTGVQAALGAFNEYIAEGNARSLKSGASLDITSILDEKVGETASERAQQIADLIEKIGMVGQTAQLAGTPMQRLSNLSDIVFDLIARIADSGVYEKFTLLVDKLANYLFNIPDDEIENLSSVIAQAVVDIMQPLENVLDLLLSIADKVRELIKENPDLIKNILKWTAVAGTFALVAGIALKLLSTLGMLKFSIGKLFGNSILESGFKLLGLFKSLLLYFGPLIAATFLLKTAWDNNFLDMQNTVKNFISETFDTLKLLFDALVDNTLSAEGFQRAKELGILPFIEAVLQLKYHLKFLFEGMKEGFNAFAETLSDILIKTGLLDKDTHGLRDTITQLLEKITQPGMTETWKEVGHWIGEIGGWVLIFIAVMPKILKVISAIATVVTAIVKAVSIIGSVVSTVIEVLEVIGAILGGLSAGMTALVLLAIAIQVAWTALVIYLVVYTITHWEEVKEYIKNAISNVIDFFKEKIESLKSFLETNPILSRIVKVVTTIVGIVTTVKNFIFAVVITIIGIIISEAIRAYNVISPIVIAIGKFFYMLYEIIRTVVLAIVLAIAVAVNWVNEKIINPVKEEFMREMGELFAWWVTGAKDIYDWVKENIFDNFLLGIDIIKDAFVEKFTFIKSFVIAIFTAIEMVVSPIFQKLKEIIDSLVDSFTIGWGMIGDFFGNAGDYFKSLGDELEGGFVGLATGGYVNTTGLAVLHPNEVVVNDVLTQRLGQFLDDYSRSSTQLPVSSGSSSQSFSPVQSYVNNNTNSSANNYNTTEETVIFDSGSIVFNVDKDTDLAKMNESELEALAEKLVKIMARKAQIRQMQTRR